MVFQTLDRGTTAWGQWHEFESPNNLAHTNSPYKQFHDTANLSSGLGNVNMQMGVSQSFIGQSSLVGEQISVLLNSNGWSILNAWYGARGYLVTKCG